MKKWFLKPEWSKADEEGQSVVFDDADHDPDDFPPPPPLDDVDQCFDDDDGSFDTPPPEPQNLPDDKVGEENMADAEGERPHQEQVSAEARRRFNELFEKEAKPRRLFQVGLVRLDALYWCVVPCCGLQ